MINTDAYKSLRAVAARMERPELVTLVFRKGFQPVVGRIGEFRGQLIERARIVPLVWMARFSDGPGGVRPCSSVNLTPSEAWLPVARLDELDRRREAIVGEIPAEVRLAFGMWSESLRVALPAYRWCAAVLGEIEAIETDAGAIRLTREVLRQSIEAIEQRYKAA